MDLSAYRIVQEALSNAMRHAPGSHVEVHLATTPTAWRLRSATTPAPARPSRSWWPAGPGPSAAAHGLVGMRERATMLGGSLEAGPTGDGGFRVAAVLPVSPSEEDAP